MLLEAPPRTTLACTALIHCCPGKYEVRLERPGFRPSVAAVQVVAGSTSTVDLALSLGATQEIVTVEATGAQIDYESHTVQGVIQRQTIEDLLEAYEDSHA